MGLMRVACTEYRVGAEQEHGLFACCCDLAYQYTDCLWRMSSSRPTIAVAVQSTPSQLATRI